jgi:hypothetical protein
MLACDDEYIDFNEDLLFTYDGYIEQAQAFFADQEDANSSATTILQEQDHMESAFSALDMSALLIGADGIAIIDNGCAGPHILRDSYALQNILHDVKVSANGFSGPPITPDSFVDRIREP